MTMRASYLVVLAVAGCSTFGGVPDPPDAAPPDASPVDGGADAPEEGTTPCSNFALAFDGSQYLEVGDGSGAFDSPQPRTFEAWINVDRQNANLEQHIVSHHTHESPSAGWVFMLLSVNPGIAFRAYGATDTQTLGGATTGVALDKWVHVAAVLEDAAGKGSLSLYVDGRRVASKPGDFPPRSKDYAGVLRIGMAAYTKDYFGFLGLIDEVRISSTPLYLAEFPKPTKRFDADADTIALWHFDETEGLVARDATGRHDAAFPSLPSERPARVPVPCFPDFGK